MPDNLPFQDIILRLIAFWKERGCLVWHPYNVQVGAGTNNPATVLRVLGPEPWNVVYLEPSIRPDDGRFGDNPNRMQWFYQLQVILKPDPGNPVELYLQSLEAIGINPRRHDIRFVEDNWESPVLGAWGLGWEVWLDGQEITQYTYFQQSGGFDLDPVSVEITYGLERIALALQEKDAVWQIEYGAGVTYGDLLLRSEIEHCEYYFNVADVEALRAVFDTYENEAKRCLAAGLVIPAHDYNLKCSHLFNVLDTRGAIGVTDRAQFFRRMRALSRQIAEKYVEQRQQLEYPLLKNPLWERPTADHRPPTAAFAQSSIANLQSLLLEIGVEELPAADLEAALAQLRAAVPALLDRLRLSYGQMEIEGTPRRLAVMVQGLAGRQQDLESEAKGPPADRAYDASGNPTPAATGFARGKGVPVESLRVVEEGNRRYVTAVVREEGRPAAEVLAEALPGLIAGLKFEKSMRWNASNASFSRPVRWLVALLGPDVIPLTYAGVSSGRSSRGLRPTGSPPVEIADAAAYPALMAEQGIVLAQDERRRQIQAAASQLAEEVGGTIPDDPALLAEVANLVERPTALRGRFEERYLALPAEALVAVMKKHQRYFPVYATTDGRRPTAEETAVSGQSLLPYFITVRNGDDQHLDVVTAGNEHVLRARFADAEFFYNRDQQHKLEEFLPRLDTLIFQAELGSYRDKSRRLERLAGDVAAMLGLSSEDTAAARRAATLAKADLTTALVVEMTSLQGIMGAHYARLSGEPEAVAAAVAEQYEAVSRTRPGLALALADRLDSLAGLFAVGLAPKGASDPFALRRATIQIIENVSANAIAFDLRQGLAAAMNALGRQEQSADVIPAILGFIRGRLEVVLQERGYRASVVRAVLAEQGHNPTAAAQAAAALSQAIKAEDWPPLLDAYARCARITRGQPAYTLRPDALRDPQEKELYKALLAAEAVKDGTVATLVKTLREIEPAISDFFDHVLVMDEDAAIRENRLALLQRVAGLAAGVADLSPLEGF